MNLLDVIPTLTVTIDGRPLADETSHLLATVRVNERLSLPTACDLVFQGAWHEEPEPHLRPGALIAVRFSADQQLLFEGPIARVQTACLPGQGREVRVHAFDRLHRLTLERQVASHVQTTALDLARDLAMRADLHLLPPRTARATPVIPRMLRHTRSAFDLLRDTLAAHGFYMRVRGRALELVTLDTAAGIPRGTLPPPLLLGGSLLEVHFDDNPDAACTQATVLGWNPFTARPMDARGSRSPAFGPTTAAAQGQRPTSDCTITNAPASVQSVLQLQVQAELDRRTHSGVVMRGIVNGDVALRPGVTVEVKGTGRLHDGHYLLTEVTHLLDPNSGYLAEVGTTAPAAPASQAERTSATVGVVARTGDPTDAGRVQVALPAFNNEVTDWLQVLSPGAGDRRGLAVPLKMNDPVLVLLLNDDPSQAIVLGSLFGSQRAPVGNAAARSKDASVSCYTLRTDAGQQIYIDEHADVVRLENRDGSFVELTPDKVQLHAAVDLDIEAPGRAIVLRGQTIDFRKG